MSQTLVVITGPTGVGKTELCIRLAERFHTDINADSRQIFREIPIGTAAPTAEQQARVKHHFVGTHSITDYYSASMYEQDVMKLLGEGSGERLFIFSQNPPGSHPIAGFPISTLVHAVDSSKANPRHGLSTGIVPPSQECALTWSCTCDS